MDFFSLLFESVDPDERFILGIDGMSRSGKTTLVHNLGMLLNDKGIPYRVLHIDDFIVERGKRYATGKEEWEEYYSLQWDVQWLKENLFKKLPLSDKLSLPFYEGETDRRIWKEVSLAGTKVVIIEGVFLLREEWSNVFDYTVFLDCPRELRFSRESKQTQRNLQKFKYRYWKAEDYYLEAVGPLEKAKMIIPCQLLKE